MSKITRLNPVWHRMLYSCTHMATVGDCQKVKQSEYATYVKLPIAWSCDFKQYFARVCRQWWTSL